jgi:hypothetical protein
MTPTFAAKHHEALANFAANYFYIGRLRLKNAILLWNHGIDRAQQNSMMFELVVGYTNYALYEFALLLFDAKENLVKIDSSYMYAEGSAVFKVIEFRRHVLAHRGSNWGSDGSRAIIESVSKNPLSILNDTIAAAKEFMAELKSRNIKIYDITEVPPIPAMNLPVLDNFLVAMPKTGFFASITNADEADRFFQRYELD